MSAKKIEIVETLSSSAMEVSFNPAKLKEMEHAKSLYREAKRLGRFVLVEGKDAESFRECAAGHFTIEAEGVRDEGQLALHIFDKTGDRRIMWRPDRPKEVKEAAALFNEYLKKGWKPYAVHRLDPKARGVRIHSFNPELDEIIFDDETIEEKLKGVEELTKVSKSRRTAAPTRTVKERLSSFSKKFNEVKMLPKSMPG